MISTTHVFAKLAEGNSLIRQWTVPADLPYFAGHFPGNPIFPAVGIVDASICVLGSLLGDNKLHVPVIPAAKFMSPIGPGTRVQVTLAQVNEREWTVDWSNDTTSGNDKIMFASLRFQVNT